MGILRFRKKPIVVEAWQVHPDDGHTRQLPPRWLMDKLIDSTARPIDGGGLEIDTLEGVMRADVGDWIIQGVKGEVYPCKPDIFEQTYEEVT